MQSTPKILALTLGFALAALAGALPVLPSRASVEATVLTSPLVGADPVDLRGRGTVVEVLAAGSYTYLRVQGVEPWLVVTGRPPEVDQALRFRGFAALRDFESQRLGRTFDTLIFATLQEEP